jgi:hypothetical protein
MVTMMLLATNCKAELYRRDLEIDTTLLHKLNLCMKEGLALRLLEDNSKTFSSLYCWEIKVHWTLDITLH